MNSRSKGKRGELEFASYLKKFQMGDGSPIEARRGVQFGCGSLENPDVISSLPVHWEVKRTNRLRLQDALDQAINDADGALPPIVAFKANHQNWIAILPMEDMMNFLGAKRVPETIGSKEDGNGK